MVGEQLGGGWGNPKKFGLDYYDWVLITSFQAKCQKSPLGLCVCVFLLGIEETWLLTQGKKTLKKMVWSILQKIQLLKLVLIANWDK
jgi:hypothetical protein